MESGDGQDEIPVLAVAQLSLRDPLHCSFVRQAKQGAGLINDLVKLTLPLDPR